MFAGQHPWSKKLFSLVGSDPESPPPFGPRDRVAWSTLVDCLVAVSEAGAGPEDLFDLGGDAFEGMRLPPFAGIDRDRALVERLRRQVGALRLSVAGRRGAYLLLCGELPADDAARCPAIFAWMAGALATVATPYPGIPASVDWEVAGASARFEVWLPTPRLWERVLQASRVLWAGQEGLPGFRALRADLRLKEGDLLREARAVRVAIDTRDRFLQTIGHELRTPLNGVLGAVRELERGPPPAEMPSIVADLAASSDRLCGVLGTLIDYAKLADQGAVPHLRPFHLGRFWRAQVAHAARQASRRGLELSVGQEGDLETWVQGDDVRIEKILRNAVDNAVSFTPSGRLDLYLDLQALPTGVQLQLTVSDTGVGIAKEHLERVFEPFFQVREGARPVRGVGLGLTVLREQVSVLGGEVAIESELCQGTTLRVRVPVMVIEHQTRGLPPGLRVLVVDDDRINRLVLKRALDKHQCETVLAADGLEALERLEDASFDVVLMDCEMPRMDGWEATRRIRVRHGLEVAVIAVTAYASETDRARCLEAGMDDVITKPVDPRALLESLERWL